MTDPVPDYFAAATSDVLSVLADALKRADRTLVREGIEGDLRSWLEKRFQSQLGHSQKETPGPLDPRYVEAHQSLLHAFWFLYDQAEKQLRVLDDPEGHA